MSVRYITYQIDDNDQDRKYFFSLLEKLNAREITEWTYKVDSTIPLEQFCTQLKSCTKDGDRITVIYKTNLDITHIVVR